MSKFKNYTLFFFLSILIIGLTACSEYLLEPRLDFTLETAPALAQNDSEQVLILKNFNVSEANQVKIQGIWVDGERITEFVSSGQDAQLEIRFTLSRGAEPQIIEVAASSVEYGINVKKVSLQ
jgi:hypothetical protein